MCCTGLGAQVSGPLQLRAAAAARDPVRITTTLRYLGPAALSLRGPFSGRVYEPTFLTELAVDPSDREALLRTGLFEPA